MFSTYIYLYLTASPSYNPVVSPFASTHKQTPYSPLGCRQRPSVSSSLSQFVWSAPQIDWQLLHQPKQTVLTGQTHHTNKVSQQSDLVRIQPEKQLKKRTEQQNVVSEHILNILGPSSQQTESWLSTNAVQKSEQKHTSKPAAPVATEPILGWTVHSQIQYEAYHTIPHH